MLRRRKERQSVHHLRHSCVDNKQTFNQQHLDLCLHTIQAHAISTACRVYQQLFKRGLHISCLWLPARDSFAGVPIRKRRGSSAVTSTTRHLEWSIPQEQAPSIFASTNFKIFSRKTQWPNQTPEAHPNPSVSVLARDENPTPKLCSQQCRTQTPCATGPAHPLHPSRIYAKTLLPQSHLLALGKYGPLPNSTQTPPLVS